MTRSQRANVLLGRVISVRNDLQSKKSKKPIDIEVAFDEDSGLRLVFTAKKGINVGTSFDVESVDDGPLGPETEEFTISTTCKAHGPYFKGSRTYFYRKRQW